jgi:ectoine hydroxylase-related dioxygenase (phytanoyl-CoA dioxygenase family)
MAISHEVAAFERDGYVLVRGLLDAEEAELMRSIAAADKQVQQKGGASADSYNTADSLQSRTISQGDGQGGTTAFWVDDEIGDDYYSAISRSERIVARMESFLGGEVYHWHHKLMLKHAMNDAGQPGGAFQWHQDFGANEQMCRRGGRIYCIHC